MSNESPSTQSILECLQATANETLERKRRLGQYAVIWEDGSIKKLFPPKRQSDHVIKEELGLYNEPRGQQN